MANAELEALKARFKAKQQKDAESKNRQGGSGIFYPFWNIKEKTDTFRFRFLKDLNSDNPNVYNVEKLEHTLSIGGKDQKIPCLKMYDNEESCPICELSAAYFKEKNRDKGLYYWHKKRYISYVYIINDPLPSEEEDKPNRNGTCAAIQLEKKLEEKITSDISSDEMPVIPWDLRNGLDFLIKRTKSGENKDFVTLSQFARTPSSLPEDKIDTIELVDLRSFLPKNPGLEKVQKLLQAHLNNTLYDENENDDGDSKPAAKPATASTAKTVPPKEEQPDQTAEEIDVDMQEFLKRKKG